jgi:dTDP-4-dehydrorhamnose reductase
LTARTLYDSVLVTGGGGMLAHAFAHVLRARGVEPRLVDRKAADVTDEGAMGRLFESSRPTLVLNCAAYTKVDLAEQEEAAADAVNGHAVGTLARLCRRHGALVVHFSTDFVFDGTGRRPYRPDDPTNPLSAYGRSKLLGETELRKMGPSWLIVRTAWLYGPGGPCFPQTMTNAARAGKPLRVVDDQVGSPTYTFDLAEATLDLLDHGARGVWHVTNSGSVSWFGFTAAILNEFGLGGDLAPTTSAEWKKLRPQSATRPAYSVLDVEPFAQFVGRPMRPWREALHDYRLRLENPSEP